MAIIVELIYSERTKGLGQSEADPVRVCYELWTKAGVQVAYSDPHKPEDCWCDPSLIQERMNEVKHYA
jgi:hypothetical protein